MMSPAEFVFRIILALILPPVSVIGLRNVGCGTVLLLCLLTMFVFLPGQIAAVILIVKEYGDSKL